MYQVKKWDVCSLVGMVLVAAFCAAMGYWILHPDMLLGRFAFFFGGCLFLWTGVVQSKRGFPENVGRWAHWVLSFAYFCVFVFELSRFL